MPTDFRTYIADCCKQVPLSWRKGTVIATAIVSLVLIVALAAGYSFEAYPMWVVLTGTGIVAAIDVLTIFPYQLWKANTSEIARLNEQIAAKGTLAQITDLYQEMVALLNDMERDFDCTQGVERWRAKFHFLEAKIEAKIEAFAGRPEAGIYVRRGLIERQRVGAPHQREMDLARHDIMHLREFIKTYSRDKKGQGNVTGKAPKP